MAHDWTYKAEVLDVIDGDTLDLRVDLGFHTYTRVRVRLADVDTNEIYGVRKESEEYKLGMEQTKFVKEWLPDDGHVTIRTEKDETGKYGRWIARIYSDGEQLADALLGKWPHVESDY